MPSLRLRIELRDVEPTTWREVGVPADLPLTELHTVIQAAMGWANAHPYSFTRAKESPSSGVWASVPLAGAAALDGATLADLAAEPGDTAGYRYDFGDDWQHELRVIEHLDEAAAPDQKVRATLLGGEGACPPEDCGGARGYAELVGWVADLEAGRPVSKRALAQLNWVAGSLDARAIRRALSYDPQVAALRVTTASTSLPPVRADVTDLLGRAASSSVLREMVVRADLEAPTRPDLDACEVLTADLRWFLDLVGSEGLELTASQHLKPGTVMQVARYFDLDRERFGKMNQEELTLPVTHLRLAATQLGLVRAVKRTLRLTGIGETLREDSRGLVELMATKLPVGAPGFERDGGLVLLLDLAGREVRQRDAAQVSSPKEVRSAVEQERREREAMIRRLGEAMASLGWRGERGPVTGWDVRKEAAGTLAVLERCGIVALDRRGAGWNPTPLGREFLVWALAPRR